MAGEWIKMRCDLHDDPAVFRMAAILKIDAYSVIGRLHTFWGWLDRHSVDGVVDGVVETDVDAIVRLDGFASALAKVGWLEISEDGIAIPKFDRHNGETAKKRALKNERQARWRAGKDGDVGDDVDGRTSTNASTREEKRREERKNNMSGSADTAKRILEYLNERADRAYRPVESNLKFILARLDEGATEEDCRAVIDAKVDEWANDVKWSAYLRPETLFNATKFSSYIGQLGATKVVPLFVTGEKYL